MNEFSIMTDEEERQYKGLLRNSYQNYARHFKDIKKKFVGFTVPRAVVKNINRLPKFFDQMIYEV